MPQTPLLILLLLVVDSLHFVFARLLLPHLEPIVSVLFVLGIATLELLAYGLFTRRLRLAVFKQGTGLFLAIGFLVAVSTTINYEAVALIDPGTASMIAQTGTIFGLALGVIWLRDKLTRPQIIGSVLAIVGVFIMEYQADDYLQRGSLLVLLSTFLYALHTAISKRFGDRIDFYNFFLLRLAFTSGFLLLFSIALGQLQWPPAAVWPLLVLVGTTDVVVSRALFYLALRRLTLSLHTLALTLSPLVAVLWALALFGTFPQPKQLVGGAAILTGVLIVSGIRLRRQETT